MRQGAACAQGEEEGEKVKILVITDKINVHSIVCFCQKSPFDYFVETNQTTLLGQLMKRKKKSGGEQCDIFSF